MRGKFTQLNPQSGNFAKQNLFNGVNNSIAQEFGYIEK